jgi:hypothetical protein
MARKSNLSSKFRVIPFEQTGIPGNLALGEVRDINLGCDIGYHEKFYFHFTSSCT